jgi:tRNA(Ile)-lysidine synthetase-like protein
VVHQLAGRSFQVMEGACMPLTDDPWRARIDASAPRGGLCWRTARPGERWQALGAPGHRSLFRWLGEHGVPERSRAAWIVLADEVGVLWVPGGTIAERARLGPGSRAALELRCDPALPARPVLQTAPP